MTLLVLTLKQPVLSDQIFTQTHILYNTYDGFPTSNKGYGTLNSYILSWFKNLKRVIST